MRSHTATAHTGQVASPWVFLDWRPGLSKRFTQDTFWLIYLQFRMRLVLPYNSDLGPNSWFLSASSPHYAPFFGRYRASPASYLSKHSVRASNPIMPRVFQPPTPPDSLGSELGLYDPIMLNSLLLCDMMDLCPPGDQVSPLSSAQAVFILHIYMAATSCLSNGLGNFKHK